MITAYLVKRVEIPSHLCWPGRRQFLEDGEGLLIIAPASAGFECMTLAGPFQIAADALKTGKWPNIFHFQCPFCNEPQTLRVELATAELQPRECTSCNQTHLVGLASDRRLQVYKPGRG